MRKQKRVEIVFMIRSSNALHSQFEAIRHCPMMAITATPQPRSRIDEPGLQVSKVNKGVDGVIQSGDSWFSEVRSSSESRHRYSHSDITASNLLDVTEDELTDPHN